MSTVALLAIGLAALSGVQAQSNICYDRYNRAYRCNNSGLGYGARIGIGIGIAAGKLFHQKLVGVLIISCLASVPTLWLLEEKKRFAHHKPPALPYAQQNNGPNNGYNPYTNNGNDYSNNPPPPQSSFQQTNSYGPQAPAQTYQPSQANNYRAEESTGNHEHGYEWEQAREAERLEREGASAGNAPPAYDPTNVGTGGGNKGYAPPSGAPPK